ncbi:Deoxynucleoside triphosphate triphosphohydrolase SAMHD1 [Bienertia sinuspersici]
MVTGEDEGGCVSLRERRGKGVGAMLSDKCANVVKEACGKDEGLAAMLVTTKLGEVSQALREWSRKEFGNIQRKIKEKKDEEKIEDVAINYFQYLFTSTNPNSFEDALGSLESRMHWFGIIRVMAATRPRKVIDSFDGLINAGIGRLPQKALPRFGRRLRD